MIRRYEVHDEDVPLQAFYTRQETEAFKTDEMFIVVLPKPKRKKIDFTNEEEAKW